MSLDSVLTERLAQRAQQQLIRRRRLLQSAQSVNAKVDGNEVVNFLSNDYLGLANHPLVKEASIEATKIWGAGSGASHLVIGHQSPHHQLEEALAEFTGRDRAVLFGSGYMANLGTINALVGKGDGVFLDRLAHASMLDGGRISQAQFHRFEHNNTVNLEEQLVGARTLEHKLVAVDGVYSMDGDFAPIRDLAAVAKRNNAWLMVDDAHGFGVVGESGRGTLEKQGIMSQEDVPILMGTLSKGLGGYGAFVAGSDPLIEWLIQRARNYIFTTALPPAVAAASKAALTLISNEPERRDQLAQRITQFKEGATARGIKIEPSTTAVQPIILGSESMTLAVANELAQKGLLVGAIRPPTVPKGTSRLRITLNAEHSPSQVELLLDSLEHVLKRVKE